MILIHVGIILFNQRFNHKKLRVCLCLLTNYYQSQAARTKTYRIYKTLFAYDSDTCRNNINQPKM